MKFVHIVKIIFYTQRDYIILFHIIIVVVVVIIIKI